VIVPYLKAGWGQIINHAGLNFMTRWHYSVVIMGELNLEVRKTSMRLALESEACSSHNKSVQESNNRA